MPKIQFAPFYIPLARRLQTLGVWYCSTLCFLGPMIGGFVFLSLIVSGFYIIPVIYFSFWLFFDFDVQARGGRRFQFMRHLAIWKYACSYFPLKLIKTADINCNRNYIFCYHPHGVISTGAFGSFSTEGVGFSDMFPGITPHLLTLKINFRWPLHRDFLLSLGMCDVSKESIRYICSKKGTGNAVIIVTGGSAESLEAYPGAATLILKNRKGFAKAALENGACLVPIYAFGENDLHKQASNPWIRRFQEVVRKITGVAPIMFYGRGIFQYSFGLMPYRVPVYIVVGAPIEVTKTEHPTQKDIDDLHGKYIDELKRLYDNHKEKYSQNPEVELKFI